MGWVADIFKEIPLSVNLQAKLDALEEKFVVLELRNKYLESEVVNLRQEIQRRDNIIQKEKSQLGEITEQILMVFFDKAKELDSEDMSYSFSFHKSVVDYHFDILLRNGLIIQTRAGCKLMGFESPPGFVISSKGREYIIKRTSA